MTGPKPVALPLGDTPMFLRVVIIQTLMPFVKVFLKKYVNLFYFFKVAFLKFKNKQNTFIAYKI